MPISSLESAIKSHPGYLPEIYYQGVGSISADSSSAAGLAVNSITYIPFQLHYDTTLIRLAIVCSSAKVGANARLGIYSNYNGMPKELLVDAGEMAVATTGVKEAIISLPLLSDWYWFAGMTNSAPNLYCATSFVGSNHILGQITPSSTSVVCALRDSAVSPYLSFPTPAPLDNLSRIVGNSAPLFWYKTA